MLTFLNSLLCDPDTQVLDEVLKRYFKFTRTDYNHFAEWVRVLDSTLQLTIILVHNVTAKASFLAIRRITRDNMDTSKYEPEESEWDSRHQPNLNQIHSSTERKETEMIDA